MKSIPMTILIVLCTMTATVAGEIGVPDLRVDRIDDGRFLYFGHVIDIESGEPVPSGYVYLLTHARQIVDGRTVESDGYFEIEAGTRELDLIYSPTEWASKVVRGKSDPLMEKIEALVMERFPRQNYGRAALILDGQSEILIDQKQTLLRIKRDLKQEIKGFDAGDASADLFFAVQKFKGFKQAELCRVEIPYLLQDGKRTHLKHTVLRVTLQPTLGRVISFYLDATPFSLSPIVTQWRPETIIEKSEQAAKEYLQAAESAVPLSASAPLFAKGDLQLWGGITVDNSLIVVGFSIYRIKPVDKKPVMIRKAFDAQVTVPIEKWEEFQSAIKSESATDFTAKLPEYAKLYTSGSIDQEMAEAEVVLEQVIYEMILKARLMKKGRMG